MPPLHGIQCDVVRQMGRAEPRSRADIYWAKSLCTLGPHNHSTPLLTGGLLVRIQPEEPTSAWRKLATRPEYQASNRSPSARASRRESSPRSQISNKLSGFVSYDLPNETPVGCWSQTSSQTQPSCKIGAGTTPTVPKILPPFNRAGHTFDPRVDDVQSTRAINSRKESWKLAKIPVKQPKATRANLSARLRLQPQDSFRAALS